MRPQRSDSRMNHIQIISQTAINTSKLLVYIFYKKMAGKKWCEYCRINLNYNKKDIQEHEETRIHLQNKQRTIKFERARLQQQQKQKRELQKQNALLGTANIPKAAKGSQLEQQINQYRNAVFNSGKAAIHQLIAERTQGLYGAPIEFPNKQDLVLAQNFKPQKAEDEQEGQSSEEFEMWRIDICEENGEPCFINNVTAAKYYEPPKGYVMSEHQREQWEYLKQICKEKVDNADNTVNISEWQEVPEEEDYFKINKVQESDNQSEKNDPKGNIQEGSRKRARPDSGREQVKAEQTGGKSWLQDLQERVNKNEVDANEIMETVIEHKLAQCKNLKEKNETLKKLIKGDIQIRQTTEGIRQEDIFGEVKQEQIVFKARKKLKTVKLTDDNDI